MINPKKAAKPAYQDDYAPLSDVNAMLNEMGVLHRRIRSMRRIIQAKNAVILYLENRR